MNETNEKKLRFSQEQKTWGLTALIVICLGILFFFACFRWEGVTGGFSTIKKILQPFVMGIVLAWLIVPLFRAIEGLVLPRLEKKYSAEKAGKVSRTVCTLASMLVLLGVIYAFFAMIIPGLIQSVTTIISNSDKYLESVRGMATRILEKNPIIEELFDKYSTQISQEITEFAKTKILPGLTNILGTVSVTLVGIVKFLVNFIIGIVVCIYILNSRRQLSAQAKRLTYATFGVRKGNTLLDAVRQGNRIFTGFIAGKIWDSLIIGVLCFICCWIMSMPYTLLVSVIVCVTNVIPCFGPFIGAIPSALLILVESPIKCLYFVLFIIILQQIDGNVIGPKILGESVGLSALWILFSIVVFGGLFGFWGMLLGVPVFTCIYTIGRYLIQKSLKKRNLPMDTADYNEVVSIDSETGELCTARPVVKQKRSSKLFAKKTEKNTENNKETEPAVDAETEVHEKQ